MIWVDLTNLPHAHLFKDFIKRHKPLVTTRRFGQLEALLDENGIKYVAVGRHGGREKIGKLIESAGRVKELAKLISKEKISLAVAKHSVELPRVAYGLGIPVAQIVDNEHAEHQNRLFLSLCSRVIVPEALDRRKLIAQGADAKSIRTFPGLCEYEHIKNFKPDKAALGDLEAEGYILVRPSAQYAAYFNSTDNTQGVIDELAERGYEIAVIPREKERYANAINIEKGDSLNLIYFAKAVVGGGGTMNRESALLGTPIISYYPQELLGVDRFLIEKKLMHHCSNAKEVIKTVERVEGQKELFRKKSRALCAAMRSPIEVLEEEISSFSARPS